MSGKDIFAAVGSETNVEIRFYNTPNFLKPWTINGCLHDKYIVADHKYLLMWILYFFFCSPADIYVPQRSVIPDPLPFPAMYL